MSLLPDDLRRRLPALYSQEGLGEEAIVYARLTLPALGWTWWVLEFDPEDQMMFCLVQGIETELGYVSLEELESSPATVRLDEAWEPKTLAAARVGRVEGLTTATRH